MKQWEIYLVRFPFTDLTSTKLRPALLISNSNFNSLDNFMFIGIFGNKWNPHYALELSNESLKEWRLTKISHLRYQNIFTLHSSIIVQKVGAVTEEFLENSISKLNSFTQIQNNT